MRRALIILAMVGRLIVMVMFSGYENFAAAFAMGNLGFETRKAK